MGACSRANGASDGSHGLGVPRGQYLLSDVLSPRFAGTPPSAAPSSPPLKATTTPWEAAGRSGLASTSPSGLPCGR